MTIPSVRFGDSIRVRQLVNPSSGRCTHLLECTRTRAAALVDPWPENAEHMAPWLQDGVKLRFELFTHAPGDAARTGEKRFDQLRNRIGLSARTRREVQGPPPPWAGLARARIEPIDRRDRWVRVRVGETVLSVPSALHPEASAYTVMGSPGPDHEIEVARVRIALGAWHVDVLPCPGDQPKLAYLVSDRLMFGGAVRTPFHSGRADHVSEAVLETLPPDTLIYATFATDGVAVSTVGQELSLARLARPRTVHSLEDVPLDALAGLDVRLTPLAAPDRRDPR